MKAKTLVEKYITAKVLDLKEVKKMKEFLELTLRMFI
jgi:hypothetical protein